MNKAQPLAAAPLPSSVLLGLWSSSDGAEVAASAASATGGASQDSSPVTSLYQYELPCSSAYSFHASGAEPAPASASPLDASAVAAGGSHDSSPVASLYQ